MSNLDLNLDLLIARELKRFRISAAAVPAAEADENATEVARDNSSDLQIDTAHEEDLGGSHTSSPTATTTGGEVHNSEDQATAHNPTDTTTGQAGQDITAQLEQDEAANGFRGAPVRLVALPGATAQDRRNNQARERRVLRLAHKHGVAPGAARWVRGGRPHLQPAVPRTGVRGDGTVEHNQFMCGGGAAAGQAVVLRMPGGWRRGLVRDRAGFLGVAVVGGFLWPRFEHGLPRRVVVDWEEQGFVEFNEVRYTTPFVARFPQEAPQATADSADGELIDLGE